MGSVHRAHRTSGQAVRAGPRRPLLGAVAAVAVGVLALRLSVATVRELVRQGDAARDHAALAADARQLAAQTSALQDTLRSALTALVGSAPLLVDGQTEAEAGAALEGLVRARADGGGLAVLRLGVAPDSSAGPLRSVRVRAELEGDVRGLSKFLQGVEGDRPLLTVASLSVTSADPVERAGAPEVLHIGVEVRGLFIPGAGR